MLRFKNLASGSSGNATVVEASDAHDACARPTRLLVDCGLGIRALQARLGEAGLALADIDAVFLTHEHSDHLGCIDKLVAQRPGLPVWASQGTRAGAGHSALGDDLGGVWREARDAEAIVIGALRLMPFAVPHDAQEPLQLTCSDGLRTLGIATDLGRPTPHVMHHLSGCDALIIECNHDPQLLAASRYPVFLQRRIAGDRGHLANAVAARMVEDLLHDRLHLLVAAHLSRENNRPELARAQLERA
ncbi:MAG: MBL fold metallo-hydrolase, partial [Comamonas sp.]